MDHIKKHVFVCINQRTADHPKGCCQSKGAIEVANAFNEAIGTSELANDTAMAGATCLGPCTLGPTVLVYPDGVWYSGVKVEDVDKYLSTGQYDVFAMVHNETSTGVMSPLDQISEY